MSTKENTPDKEDEVELGQLFKLIGAMFTNFFNFIGNIFKGAFQFLILVLIQLYRGIKWYVSAVVIGVVVGYFIDKNSDDLYGANLYIETNFGSSLQVYENIKNLHQLAFVDKDTVELADRLGITEHEATKIKGFYIEPIVDEIILAENFSIFKMLLDSVSQSKVIFKEYKEGLSNHNYKLHKIGVATTDKFVFQKLRNKLVTEMTSNDYLKQLQEVAIENLEREQVSLNKEQIEIDFLANEYLSMRKRESEKEAIPGNGTNIFLASSEGNSILIDESALFQKKFLLETRKREIQLEFVEQQNIVNVISDFPSSGYDISEWYDKRKFVLPIVFFTMTFLGSLLLLLVKYLKGQEVLLNKNKA